MSLQDTGNSNGSFELRERLLDGLMVTTRRVELAGVSTSIIEGGGGPPLIMLHGQGPFAATTWLRVIPRLVTTHHVIAPDLPGLGESVVRDGTLDKKRIMVWMEELLQKTCDEPPTVVGISLGGTIAAHCASDGGTSYRQVVLVDSGSLRPFRPAPAVMVALIRSGVRPSKRNFDRFARQVFVDFDLVRSRVGERWQLLEAYGLERAAAPSVQAANRQLLKQLGLRMIPEADLRHIRVPVALIWGRQDRVMKLRIAEWARDTLGWPLHVIDNCGHVTPVEQPDAFIDALYAAMAAL